VTLLLQLLLLVREDRLLEVRDGNLSGGWRYKEGVGGRRFVSVDEGGGVGSGGGGGLVVRREVVVVSRRRERSRLSSILSGGGGEGREGCGSGIVRLEGWSTVGSGGEVVRVGRSVQGRPRRTGLSPSVLLLLLLLGHLLSVRGSSVVES